MLPIEAFNFVKEERLLVKFFFSWVTRLSDGQNQEGKLCFGALPCNFLSYVALFLDLGLYVSVKVS